LIQFKCAREKRGYSSVPIVDVGCEEEFAVAVDLARVGKEMAVNFKSPPNWG
jgi:hypothetical protein